MIWRFNNLLFGWQYVTYYPAQGSKYVGRAFKLGDKWFSGPYSHTSRLTPNGHTDDSPMKWHPLTKEMFDFYKPGNMAYLELK